MSIERQNQRRADITLIRANQNQVNLQETDFQTSLNRTTQRQTVSNCSQQFHEYSQSKQTKDMQLQGNQAKDKNLYVVIVSIAFVILFMSAMVYLIKYKANSQSGFDGKKNGRLQPPNHFYTRHQHHSAIPSANPTPSQLCNKLLPFGLGSQKVLQENYYKWYGKKGEYLRGRSFATGHFVQRHVAVGEQCTDEQYAQGKTVFYDWNQVTKAFAKTALNKCPLADKTTFSYDFETRIASPTDYIKGIDCRTGAVKKFSRVLILYRRAIDKSRPTQDQYFNSNYLTIWTFYPKN